MGQLAVTELESNLFPRRHFWSRRDLSILSTLVSNFLLLSCILLSVRTRHSPWKSLYFPPNNSAELCLDIRCLARSTVRRHPIRLPSTNQTTSCDDHRASFLVAVSDTHRAVSFCRAQRQMPIDRFTRAKAAPR